MKNKVQKTIETLIMTTDLNEQQKIVLIERLKGKTQKEIAKGEICELKKHNKGKPYNPQRISQIERSAIVRLRHPTRWGGDYKTRDAYFDARIRSKIRTQVIREIQQETTKKILIELQKTLSSVASGFEVYFERKQPKYGDTQPLDELDIPTQIINALKSADIYTVEDLRADFDNLWKIQNIGPKSIGYLEQFIT